MTYNYASAIKNGEDLGVSPLESSVTWDDSQFYDINISSRTKSGSSYQLMIYMLIILLLTNSVLFRSRYLYGANHQRGIKVNNINHFTLYNLILK